MKRYKFWWACVHVKWTINAPINAHLRRDFFFLLRLASVKLFQMCLQLNIDYSISIGQGNPSSSQVSRFTAIIQ